MKKGTRLSTILRKLYLVHLQNPISPARKDGYIVRETGDSIDSHQTGWEYGNRPIRDKNRQILGDFYEFMTAGIYGGVVRKNIEVAPTAYIEPDVLNEETKQGFESKAVNTSQKLKVDDHQIQRYHRLQFHMQDYDFYFAVYRHNLKGLKDYEQENLPKILSDKTIGSIIIPLSLITYMNSVRDKDFVYRYEGERWPHTTTIRSHILNRFFGDMRKGTEKEIIEELGANPGDYRFKRLMSPLEFYIKGNKINPFPIMFISDKSHKRWIKWFLENCEIQEEISFGENGDTDMGVKIVLGYDVLYDGCSDKEEIPKDSKSESDEIPF